MHSQAKTADEAKSLGLKRYFTGEPCVHGHVAERSLRGECIECRKRRRNTESGKAGVKRRNRKFYENMTPEQEAVRAKWAEDNREARLAYMSQYAKDNREQRNERQREWREKNPGANAAHRHKHYAANPEKHRAGVRAWELANPGAKRALTAKRRAAQKMATPAWADHKKIAAIYAEAARQGLHVDHEIPLAGELVCGLHVETNLQLLTKQANSAKSNSFDSDAFDHPYSTLVLFSAFRAFSACAYPSLRYYSSCGTEQKPFLLKGFVPNLIRN